MITEDTENREILTRLQCADLLGISLMCLYSWTRAGKLTAYKIGDRHVFYLYSEVLAAMKKYNYQTEGDEHN